MTNTHHDMDGDLLPIFLEEAREQIDSLDQGLVRLEREPGNVELIQGIFRAAHTLKGSSAAMGLTQMAELTHAMEDVLDRIRGGTLGVNTTVVDALLQGLDLLRTLEQAVEDGSMESCDDAGFARTVDSLHAAREGRTPGMTPAGDVVLETPGSAGNTAPLGVIPETQVALLVNFTSDCGMPGIRAFMIVNALDRFASVVRMIPSQDEIDQGKIAERLLLVVESDALEDDIINAVMGVGEVCWMRSGRGMEAAGLYLHMEYRDDNDTCMLGAPVDSSPAKPASMAALHEVATPSAATSGAHAPQQQTIRVSVETLDSIMNLVGELVLDRTRVMQLKEELRERYPNDNKLGELDSVSQHLESIVGELHEQIFQTRLLPVSQLFNRFPRMVRDLTHNLGKSVDFILEGESERVDRTVIERLVDPLTHILRNSVDHGMETPEVREARGKPHTGRVVLSARRQEDNVLIAVQDDGPGIDADRLRAKALERGLITPAQAENMTRQDIFGLIFVSGFSTAAVVSDVSGRGVGMDVVKRNVEGLGGSIVVDSELGQGTTVTLKIPLTLAIVRALIVRVGEVAMALPLSQVEETLSLDRQLVHLVRDGALISWRDQVVPLVPLHGAFPGCGEHAESDTYNVVAVRSEGRILCLAVDAIIGHQEIVVKPLGAFLGEVPGMAGATILGNGRVALIVDLASLSARGLLAQAAESLRAA